MVLFGIFSRPSLDQCAEYGRNGENWLDIGCSVEPTRCLLTCEKYNLTFSAYDNGGFGSDECWCYGHEPVQVY